jgi:hypothetical protein
MMFVDTIVTLFETRNKLREHVGKIQSFGAFSQLFAKCDYQLHYVCLQVRRSVHME